MSDYENLTIYSVDVSTSNLYIHLTLTFVPQAGKNKEAFGKDSRQKVYNR